ncbi:hypothetical protein ACHAXA_010659 [Cyclostephanos tholiformis]|uniref:Uncharacterized protein n=1 Tax=Cyclostephanos tholiformis TaxID=382380 RepID=A0ABD3RT74_9STRA
MNQSISSLVVVVVVVVVFAAVSLDTASGFTSIRTSSPQPRSTLAPKPSHGLENNGPSSSSSSFAIIPPPPSVTALNLKVKIDPEAAKTKVNKNVAGNAKMAAYGGSVVIALMLPIAFLVWSAVSK